MGGMVHARPDHMVTVRAEVEVAQQRRNTVGTADQADGRPMTTADLKTGAAGSRGFSTRLGT